MATTPPRVRFAPSPTGLLHVGGVRSALYNYLLARGAGGAFVLRIEDTDETREHPEAIDQIQRSLRWCGLDWDEGPGIGGPYAPYLQSERRASHTAAAERLLADGKAYRCWCTPEELEAERAEARAANRPHIYSRRCLSRGAEEIAALEAEGRRPAIRFRMPDEGEVVIDDLVRGETRWAIDLLGDHVIVRPGGVPTYNFANPVDDMGMQITHVLRGEDLLPSTPRQVLTYEALGAPVPRFAHLSMILGPDRKRLSKRHGATSVEAFRDAGYVSEAVVNYLALLGWSYDDSRELFTLPELVEAFSIERVNASAAVLDFTKLEWMNGVYLRAMAPAEYAERLLAYLAEAGSDLAAQPEIVRRAAPLVQEKLATFAEFDGYCRFLFGPVEIDPAAWTRVEGNERAGEILSAARADLAALPAWTTDALDGALRGLTERLGAKPKVAFTPIRVALTGRTVAPGLFESAEALGREETLARLDAAAARLAA